MFLNIKNLYKTWDKRYCDFLEQYQGVVIACSGGIDSTALFYLLWNFLKNKKNYFLGIAHVNFKFINQILYRFKTFRSYRTTQSTEKGA